MLQRRCTRRWRELFLRECEERFTRRRRRGRSISLYTFESIDSGDIFFWRWRWEGPVWTDRSLSARHVRLVGHFWRVDWVWHREAGSGRREVAMSICRRRNQWQQDKIKWETRRKNDAITPRPAPHSPAISLYTALLRLSTFNQQAAGQSIWLEQHSTDKKHEHKS